MCFVKVKSFKREYLVQSDVKTWRVKDRNWPSRGEIFIPREEAKLEAAAFENLAFSLGGLSHICTPRIRGPMIYIDQGSCVLRCFLFNRFWPLLRLMIGRRWSLIAVLGGDPSSVTLWTVNCELEELWSCVRLIGCMLMRYQLTRKRTKNFRKFAK